MKITRMQKSIGAILAVAATAAALLWSSGLLSESNLPDSLASGNGRIEAVQVDVASKLPGRVSEVLVQEGDLVEKDQLLARLDNRELTASSQEAQAQYEQTRTNPAINPPI